jgi:hypothetical protein
LKTVVLRPEEGPPVSVNVVNTNISRKALAYLKAPPRVRKAGGGIQLEADDDEVRTYRSRLACPSNMIEKY